MRRTKGTLTSGQSDRSMKSSSLNTCENADRFLRFVEMHDTPPFSTNQVYVAPELLQTLIESSHMGPYICSTYMKGSSSVAERKVGTSGPLSTHASAAEVDRLSQQMNSTLSLCQSMPAVSLKNSEELLPTYGSASTQSMTSSFMKSNDSPSFRSVVVQFKSATEATKLKLDKMTIAAQHEVLKSLAVLPGNTYTVNIQPVKRWELCQELHLQNLLPTGATNVEGTKVTAMAPSAEWWEKLKDSEYLQKYLRVCFDGSLVFPSNFYRISLHGVMVILRVVKCLSRVDEATKSEHMLVPLRVDRTTRITLSFHSSGDEASDKSEETLINNKSKRFGLERVGGLRDVLEDLKLYVILPLCHPEVLRKYGLHPPKGIILFGPPGTGKTFLVKCLAEELTKSIAKTSADSPPTVHVELIQATDLISPIVGATESNINGVFLKCTDRAKKRNQTNLVFIDEIDAICPNRDDATESGKRAVATFLNCLDGIHSTSNLILIGATNRLNSIDPALRRAGRLEKEIEIGVPSSDERFTILNIFLEDIPHALDARQLEEVSSLCQAFVGADLRTLISTAAFIALEGDFKKLDAFIAPHHRHSILEDSLNAAENAPKIELEHFKRARQLIKPSGLKELSVEIPQVHWEDIGGYNAVKEKLQECVEWPYKHKAAFAKLHLNPPRGILLYGPPGCSKTMMAKAVATESHMNFISIKGPEIFSKWVGESERTIRELFRKARQNAPCVVFFDEVDALGGDRGSTSGEVSSRVLSQLLNEMDGIGSVHEVVVIGATNRPDVIDSALMRPGRFDRHIYVPLPDTSARNEIFKSQLLLMPMDYTSFAHEECFTHGFIEFPTVDDICSFLSSKTSGYSGAEAVLVCREAAMFALRESIGQQEKVDKSSVSATAVDIGASRSCEKEQDIQKQDRNSDNCIVKVMAQHFTEALNAVKPRISAETVEFYENYQSRHN